MGKQKASLRSGLVTAILICWLMPVICIVALSGLLLNSNYQKAIRQQIQSEVTSALQQVQTNLADAIWDSKAVSYDGIIRSAFRSYSQDGNSAQLYRATNDYMTQNFSRESRYRAAFLRYWGDGAQASSYALCRGTTGHDLLVQVKSTAPWIVEAMQDADTDLRFYNLDGNIYMARNILSSQFQPYATIAVLLDSSVILQSIQGITRASSLSLTVDDCTICQTEDAQPAKADWESDKAYGYDLDLDFYNVEKNRRHRIFIPKSVIQPNGNIPTWILEKKIEEIKDKYAGMGGFYIDKHPFKGHSFGFIDLSHNDEEDAKSENEKMKSSNSANDPIYSIDNYVLRVSTDNGETWADVGDDE